MYVACKFIVIYTLYCQRSNHYSRNDLYKINFQYIAAQCLVGQTADCDACMYKYRDSLRFILLLSSTREF